MSTEEERREKYTPLYYRTLKRERGLRWKEVPFTCVHCGETFFRRRVKPRNTPINCGEECRTDAFNPSIGRTTSSRIAEIDQIKVRRMIMEAGKSGPQIAEDIGVSLVTMHKYVKRKMGLKILNKMKENGKKNRIRGGLLALQQKKDRETVL